MKIFKLFLSLLLLFTSIINYSQNKPEGKKIKISGKVIEKGTNIPLEYSTISLKSLATNKVVAGGRALKSAENFKIIYDLPNLIFNTKLNSFLLIKRF
jgi:electron transfer flavoprotein alpha subunit